MVKVYFETLTPGMKAKLDAKHRARKASSTIIRKIKHSSVNCMLSDAVKMPFNRTQA